MKIRRGPILLVVLAAVVAAIVLDQTASTRVTAGTSAAVAVSAEPSVPTADTLSTSWYCADGTSNPDGRADERILIANLSVTPADATVTVMPGGTRAPVSQHLRLRARGERELAVSDVLATPEPGVVVEVVGGQVVVQHELSAEGDAAVEPCARAAASSWYFANGTTVKGSQQYLALFNPFGDDAIVDTTLLTDSGVQQPDALQALVVPRRSRITIAVHTVLERQNLIAAFVHARVGRIVAERSMIFDGTTPDGAPTRKGIAVSLGATSPATSWSFPYALGGDSVSQSLAVANFGGSPTSVEVTTQLDGDQTLVPQKVDIPPHSVAAVDPAAHVPAGSHATVTVVARDAEGTSPPVVAELMAWWSAGDGGPAVATAVGLTRPARRWVFALPQDSSGGAMTALNAGAEPATASFVAFDEGQVRGPTSEPETALGAARFGTFDLSGHAGRLLVVTSDRPVSVGVAQSGGGQSTLVNAVPDVFFPG